ncbi:MAG: nuclear transport factor 2 family protein [Chryseolinea sp.]
METVAKKQSKEVVQDFFTAFGNGDFNGVINSFHDSCTVIAIRDSSRSGNQIYGTYKGKDGAKTFLSNLGAAFETKAFTIENIMGEGNVSFANGSFTHVVKSTGKSFQSDWALMCVIKDDKIVEYHFYEDSEKFSEANK